MRIILAVLLALPEIAAAQQAQIGAAAAVAGKVQAAGKILQSGAPIYQNDRVTTDAQGRLQILLLDETVFTIGPNSDMTLDEFVYDPSTSAGKVSAKVTKGVFRFVTGKVARRDPSTMKVTTPVGTIGIRGTIAGGQVDGDKTTVVLLGPGVNNNTGDTPGGINVGNSQGSVDINQPNYGTTMGEGSGPSDPQPMPEFAASLSESLDNDATGGSSTASNTDSEKSVSEESGQETAAAGTGAVETEESTESSEESSEQSTFAAQDEAQEKGLGLFTTWDQMRDLGGNPGGQWLYEGSSSYSCAGGVCSAGSSGTVDVDLAVDFSNRTIGSAGSDIMFTGGALNAVNTSIFSIDFSAFEGDAKLTLYGGAQISNTDFNGTVITFLNDVELGEVATDAIIDVKFLDSSGAAAGATVVAPGGIAPIL